MMFPDPPDYDPYLRYSAVRHPHEHSRLILAVCCLGIVFIFFLAISIAASGFLGLLLDLFVILILVGSVWLFARMWKARLLGRAIKVTPESFPELHAEIAGLQRKLDYRRPIDVYVVDEVEGKMTVTTLLGTRVLLIEGAFAADLQAAGPASLRFILGSFIGWLKARHGRLALFVIILDHLKWLAFIDPWILPYLRSTEYTCDQFGYLCAEDLNASLGVIVRLTVGKEFGAIIAPTGVLEQAYRASRRPLSRYAELFQAGPHMVNRYVNLIAFAGSLKPADFERFRAGLNEKGRRLLGDLLVQSPHRRPSGAAPGRWPVRS